MSDRKRKALVSLLDDPDEKIYLVIKQVIKSESLHVISDLEMILDSTIESPLKQIRAKNILREIRNELIIKELEDWKSSSEKDLLQGIITLSKIHNPKLDEIQVKSLIENLRRDVWLELNDYQTAFEQVNIFNHVFYNVHGFKCITNVGNLLENLNIEEVLLTKQGNPLIVGLLYSVIAQMLELPIYGVDLPSILILAHMDENHSSFMMQQENEFGVLFYINPSKQGNLIDSNEIHSFLKNLELRPKRAYFEPTSNTTLIRRFLSAFEDSLRSSGDVQKLEEIFVLKDLL